jgi:4-alpha-glucanotransferase
VDPAASPEFAASTLASTGVTVDAARNGNASRIDYRGWMRERRRQIETLLTALDAAGGARRDAIERAADEDDELRRYASFRAAVEMYRSTWDRWPSRARSGSLRPGVDFDGETFRYHVYAQLLAREQIGRAVADSPAGLYLDLPLGSHPGGYDTWRHADEFAQGIAFGAPPDAVFAGGQNWGFPPMHPERARTTGYACWRAALRHHFAHAAVLRVDHVMALHRAFWIPDGFDATDGVYVRYRSEELWSMLAIEAAAARGGLGAAVIGEDLGTVPDEVRSQMHARGALRMHVVPFECRDDADRPVCPPPRESMVCLGTHDMEPFAAWWDAPSTPRDRIAAYLGCEADPAQVLPALVAWMSASDATVVCANVEDFWLERERQNAPGSVAGDANWQRPFARTFEDFTTDTRIRYLVDLVRGTAMPGDLREAEAS